MNIINYLFLEGLWVWSIIIKNSTLKTYISLVFFFFVNITIIIDRVNSNSIVTRTRAVESPLIMSSTENFSILCYRNPSLLLNYINIFYLIEVFPSYASNVRWVWLITLKLDHYELLSQIFNLLSCITSIKLMSNFSIEINIKSTCNMITNVCSVVNSDPMILPA